MSVFFGTHSVAMFFIDEQEETCDKPVSAFALALRHQFETCAGQSGSFPTFWGVKIQKTYCKQQPHNHTYSKRDIYYNIYIYVIKITTPYNDILNTKQKCDFVAPCLHPSSSFPATHNLSQFTVEYGGDRPVDWLRRLEGFFEMRFWHTY